MKSLQFKSSQTKKVFGEIEVPGDKSISHRAIMLGSIAKGITTIDNFLEGEDCLATLQAFQLMGVQIERSSLSCLRIQGVGKQGLTPPNKAIHCGNSGTTIRLLAGLLAAQPFNSELTGDVSLKNRPMERISKPLLQMGAHIETTNAKPPLFIQGNQSLRGITYEMPQASAQVKSCLLLAGLYAKGKTKIIEPGITRDHTERMLKAFSYPIDKEKNVVTINSNGECLGTHITVPGDISSAAFFIVAATLIPDSELLIRNVGINPTRTGIIQILNQMGAHIALTNKRLVGEEMIADIFITHAPLKGITIPLELVPLAIDEFPIIFVAAAVAQGETLLHGAKELRVKESDRIGAMVEGLQTLGIEAKAFDDGISIVGGKLRGGLVDSYGDHRIAMAFSVAGGLSSSPVTIQNCANVATSFPNFVKTANQINLTVQEIFHE